MVFELVGEFLGAAFIELVGGGAIEGFAALLDVHGIAGGGIGGEELLGGGARDNELAELGDDDGPAEHGEGGEDADGGLAFGGGLFKGELEGAGGEERMEQGGHR